MYRDFIYSSDPMAEELAIEANARDDYLAELAAEHVDHYAYDDCDDFDFVGPPAPFIVVKGQVVYHDEDLPF